MPAKGLAYAIPLSTVSLAFNVKIGFSVCEEVCVLVPGGPSCELADMALKNVKK